jgi:hypothetical protein
VLAQIEFIQAVLGNISPGPGVLQQLVVVVVGSTGQFIRTQAGSGMFPKPLPSQHL